MEVRKAEWETKCWGRVNHVFTSISVAVSCLETMPGFCCSIHYHDERINLFSVQEGVICVEVWPISIFYDSIAHVLRAGDVLSVPISMSHRFSVLEGGFVTEVYTPRYGTVRQDDINRFDKGGPFDVEALIERLRQEGKL